MTEREAVTDADATNVPDGLSEGRTVTDARHWVETRRPKAPADLHERVVESVLEAEPGHQATGEGERDRAARRRIRRLVEAARARLDAARARPGRVRASAFDLLVADALVTYACEAALETEDAATALEAIVEVGLRQ